MLLLVVSENARVYETVTLEERSPNLAPISHPTVMEVESVNDDACVSDTPIVVDQVRDPPPPSNLTARTPSRVRWR